MLSGYAPHRISRKSLAPGATDIIFLDLVARKQMSKALLLFFTLMDRYHEKISVWTRESDTFLDKDPALPFCHAYLWFVCLKSVATPVRTSI